MAPKIVDKEARRKEIAAAAMDLFVRKGFENTSIREITAAASMGKGTFYDYFADKEAILDTITRNLFDRWGDMYVTEMKKHADPTDRLRAMVALFVTQAAEFEPLMVIYIDLWRLGVHRDAEPPFLKRFRECIADARVAVAALLDRMKVAGRIRPDVDTGAMAGSLVALIDGLAFHRMIDRDGVDPDRMWQPFFEAWLKGVA